MNFNRIFGILKVLLVIALILSLVFLVTSSNILRLSKTSVTNGKRVVEGTTNKHATVNDFKNGKLQERDGKFKELDPNHLSSEIRNKIETLLLFIGYPRSGHTLIGSLLDAHPHIVIANEYNMIGRWKNWTAKEQNARNLFDQLYKNSYHQSSHGFRSINKLYGRTYAVPNQWQGKYKNFITVIGDKKGGRTTQILSLNEQTLTNISRTVKLPIKIIHMVRNPFDNIATMVLRKLNIRTSREKLMKNPVKGSERLLGFAKYYISIALANKRLIQKLPHNIITLRSEDTIKYPKKTLGKLCRFLQVTCTEDYLRDCAGIVYKKPSKSRLTMFWTEDTKRYVLTRIARIPFLKGYSFDE